MKKIFEYKLLNTLELLRLEQTEPESNEQSKTFSIYSDNEQKFLGHFDKVQDIHLGVIYSVSDIGMREFLTRSGNQLNCNPALLFSLIKKGVIKIVPSSGYGHDTTYTIELQLPLTDVEGMAEKITDTGDAAAGGDAGDGADIGGAVEGGADIGGAPAGGEAEEPAGEEPPELEGMPTEWVVNYKDIINESTKIAKRLINERSSKKKL